jgi:biopolymer transport protein ExbB/TolQ
MRPAIVAARRASERAAAVVHLDMKKRVDSLATIAVTAPWLGLFGTVIGIFNSFPALGTEKYTALAITASRLGDALAPAAFGVVIALMATCFRSYLLTQIEALDLNMESATLRLLNDLSG